MIYCFQKNSLYVMWTTNDIGLHYFLWNPSACHPLVKPIWPLHDCDLFLFCWIAEN